MIKGDYQGTGGYLPNDQVKRLREAPNVKILEAESMRIMLFQINNQRPPLNDVNVRRAISYVFDYDGLQQGDPRRLRRAQPGADPQQSVGRAEGREGLYVRRREGQAGARPRQGRRWTGR